MASERDKHPDFFAADLAKLIDMVATGQLRPVVGRVWPFLEAKQSLEGLEANTHTGKQIVLVAEE